MRRLIAVQLLLLGVTSAWAEALPPTVRTIGVYSSMGDTIDISNGGDSKGKLLIPDWGIDQIIISTATQALGSRFNVVPMRFDGDFVQTSGFPKGPPPLKPMAGGTSVGTIDAYLIVHVTPYTNPPGKWQMTCFGDGLGFEWTDSIWLRMGLECANFEVELKDGSGKDLLDPQHSVLPSGLALRDNEPIVTVPKQKWPDDAGHFTQTQVDALRSDYHALVVRAVSYTLQRMGLAQQP